MTFLIVIRDIETHTDRTFEVGIDQDKVNISLYSDALFAVRSAYAFWNQLRYQARKSTVISNGTREHNQIVEVGI